MTFSNLFKKQNKPIDSLRHYLIALENGDREQLLDAVILGDDGRDPNHALINFALETAAAVSGFRDIYGRDMTAYIHLVISPLHRSDEVNDALFSPDGDRWRAKMKDGYEYVLAKVGDTWRVQWPDFKINNVVVDADIALAATPLFAKARISLGQDFVTAQQIGMALQDSLSIALAPFAGRMPKQYSTFPRHNLLEIQSRDVEPALRSAIETAYGKFRKSVIDKDPAALLAVTRIRDSEREILDKKVKSGDFADFADWITGTSPALADTTFVTIKTDGDDFAAYYFAWNPAYSDELQNLSVRKFRKDTDGWKMLYSFADASDIPLTVGSDEDLNDRILEEVETNPFIKMKHPTRKIAAKAAEPFDAALKENLSAVYDAHRQTLVDGDLDAFLTTVRASLSDMDNLASTYHKLFPEILAFYPPRTEATFVTIRRHNAGLAGYYQIIHEPTAPEFETVILIPFVHYAGQWKIIVSLDNIPRMSLLSAKSEGDKISRAFELIDMPGTILALEGIRSLFEDSLMPDDQRNVVRALKAIERGEYGTAAELLQPMAKRGKTRAKTILGRLYAKGNGVEQDYERAFKLFSDSAMHGDGDALYYLGYAYLNGEGVEADKIWGLACLMAAGEFGHDRAKQDIEKAPPTLEDGVNRSARKRASLLVSEIIERKKATQIRETNQ